MAQVAVTKEIPASQERVWSVLSDAKRFEEWLTLHTKWKEEPPTQIGQGTQLTEVVTIMGMPNTIQWTVDEYDAPNRLKISGEGMAGAKVAFTLAVEPKGDDACEASIDAEFVSQMMVGAIGSAVERASKTEIETSLDNLTKLV